MSKFKYYIPVGRLSCQLKGVTVPAHPGPKVREILFKEGRSAIAKNRAYLKKRFAALPADVRSLVARRRRAMKGGEWLRKSAEILWWCKAHVEAKEAGFELETPLESRF